MSYHEHGDHQDDEPPTWIEEVSGSRAAGLLGFPEGLAADLDAVTTGFTIE
ncbi:hypothetical protein [Streptomyces sp. NBC_00996]|uniref:hypothetical protein n=1 Tax=Streptomyces sp. NBC_00996 TaxID=2903710 RepID=UPI0038667ADE|nr:hypothetical protein OG390_48275 [Streptomyces sp. NBC_00996]